jgi:hypothetical protein
MVATGKRATKYGAIQNYRDGVSLSQPGKRKKKREQKENIIKKRLEAFGPLFFLPITCKNQSKTDLQSLLYRLPYVFTSDIGMAVRGLKMGYRGIAKISRCFVAFAIVETSKNFLSFCIV